MRLLFLIASASCAVLLVGIAALWWKLRRLEPAPAATAARKPPTRERRAHPRLDLAAGIAPAAQTVRARQRGQGLQRQDAVAAETPLGRRSDRAYFNPGFGDLRDPDMHQAPAGGVLRPTGSLGKRER